MSVVENEKELIKRRRAVVRAGITKIIGNVESEMQKDSPDAMKLRVFNQQLSDKEENLDKYDEDYQVLLSDEELESDIAVADDWKQKTLFCKLKLEERIKSFNPVSSSTARHNSAVGHVNQVFAPSKIPVIDLPKFDGTPSNWLSFWTRFESTIDKNSNLSKTDKMNHLLSLLTGRASAKIQGLSISEESYEVALELLKTAYDRKDLAIQSHIYAFRNLPCVKKSSDVLQLTDLYDACMIHYRSIQALGEDPDVHTHSLVPYVLDALPEDLVSIYDGTLSSSEDCKLSRVLDFVKRQVENRSRRIRLEEEKQKVKQTEAQNTPTTQPSQKCSQNNKKFNKFKMASASALLASGHKTDQTKSPTVSKNSCLFCKLSGHSSKDCNLDHQARFDVFKREGRCFNCSLSGHRSNACPSPRRRCDECKARHSEWFQCLPRKVDNGDSTCMSVNATSCFSSIDHEFSTDTVLMAMLNVSVCGPQSCVKGYGLLDLGSQLTFVTARLVRQLRFPIIGEVMLDLHSVSSDGPKSVRTQKVKVLLHNSIDRSVTICLEALVLPEITSTKIKLPDLKHFNGLKEASICLAIPQEDCGKWVQPDLLIGLDAFWELVTGNIHRIDSKMVAVETKVGWCLCGPLGDSNSIPKVALTSCCITEGVEQLDETLKQFWTLESLGIVDDNNSLEQIHHDLDSFERNLIKVGDRYQVQLPWKDEKFTLATNQKVAEYRLNSLVRSFKKDPIFYQKYEAVIKEQIATGILEKAPIKQTPGRTYYLPHHAVEKCERSTTKIRIVCDGSSKAVGERSLNECLEIGPNLLPDLLKVLLKFRRGSIGIAADISKAFHQISLHPEDRDAVRLLWIEGLFSNAPPQLIHLRHARVLFGAGPSPYLLNATLRCHIRKYEKEYPETVKELWDIYVDDLITSKDEPQRAVKCCVEAKQILNEASMPLVKWRSNSAEVINEMKGKFHSTEISTETSTSVLGMHWDLDNDTLSVLSREIDTSSDKLASTKRNLLRVVASIFDPLGLISPFTVIAKMMLQAVWSLGVQWDEELPSSIRVQWERWSKEVDNLKQVSVPRWSGFRLGKAELHLFSDASERAYGSCAYLRIVNQDSVQVTLLVAKTKVAPLKKVTIPRLELLGALLSSRISSKLKEVYSVSQVFFWTDSSIVLSWIRSSPDKWKPFVSNRIREIQSTTCPSDWNHCPGDLNPADRLSRGQDLSLLLTDMEWWNGPQWLQALELPHFSGVPVVMETELRGPHIGVVTVNVPKCLDWQRYSSFERLLRIICYVKRFIMKCRKQVVEEHINSDEIRAAEVALIKIVQAESYEAELKALQTGKSCPPSSKLYQICPFLDEHGVLRLGGRLQFTSLSFNEKHPMILPRKHPIVKLVIMDCHNKVFHSGVNATLIQVRENFWSPALRQQVKGTLSTCRTCLYFKAKPMSEQMAPLPEDRVTQAPPFARIGIDFAGPLFLSDMGKSYIVLFTCAVTRALHLELVLTLDVDNFIKAFRRFIARRGVPELILSDNARTFKRADKELGILFSFILQPMVKDFLTKRRITWRYIVEAAPWWGGFWERLVRSVKECLRRTLGKAHLSADEMYTVLTEIEAIVNSRPLMDTELDGSYDPLTPSHFLIGKRLVALPSPGISLQHTDVGKICLMSKWKHRLKLVEKFWGRWTREYMLELRNFQSCHVPKEKRTPSVGQLVLIMDPKIPRLMWKLGRVEELRMGRDSKPRSCIVTLPSNKKLNRPIQKLCPLELID